MSRRFYLYIVSVDFDTKVVRSRSPYYRLDQVLNELGAVLGPTLQIRILLSPLKAPAIRDRIEGDVLEDEDRVYVGKIARGSAWRNLHRVTSKELKLALATWAKGSTPTRVDVEAAKLALKDRFPFGKG